MTVYQLTSEQWGVCSHCGFHGNPTELLSQAINLGLPDILDLIGKACQRTIEPKHIGNYSNILRTSNNFERIFHEFSTIDRYIGPPVTLSQIGLQPLTSHPLLHEIVRVTTKSELKAKLAHVGIKCRLTSDGHNEAILLLPLKDAPYHYLGFLTISGEGYYPDDFTCYLFRDNSWDCGFVTHDHLPFRKDVVFTSELPVYLQTQNLSLHREGQLMDMACYFLADGLHTQYHTGDWQAFQPTNKTVWAPLAKRDGIIAARRNHAKITPVGPGIDTLEKTQEWIRQLRPNELRIHIASTAVDWREAVSRYIQGQTQISGIEELLLGLKLNQRDYQSLKESMSDESLEKLREAKRVKPAENLVSVGAKQYTEAPDGWYALQRNAQRRILISDTQCHVQAVISVPPLKQTWYDCLVTFRGKSVRHLMPSKDFEQRLVASVTHKVANRFFDVAGISVSSHLYKQLVAGFSRPKAVKLTSGCGWHEPSGSFVLPRLKVVNGHIADVKTKFPIFAPGRSLTPKLAEIGYNKALFGKYEKYCSQVALLLAGVLHNVFVQSFPWRASGLLLITDTPKPYEGVLQRLTGMFTQDNFNDLADYTRLHKWPFYADIDSLAQEQAKSLFKDNSPHFSKAILRVPVLEGTARVLFGDYNLLFLNNVRVPTQLPKSMGTCFSSVFLRILRKLTERNLWPILTEFNRDLVLFTEIYHEICEEMGLEPACVSNTFVAAGSDLPPTLFADAIALLRYSEKLGPDDFYEENDRLFLKRKSLTSAFGRLIGFYCEGKILQLLDKTDARPEYGKQSYLSIDNSWYASRVSNVESVYGKYRQFF